MLTREAEEKAELRALQRSRDAALPEVQRIAGVLGALQRKAAPS